jgi:hypothetical protein
MTSYYQYLIIFKIIKRYLLKLFLYFIKFNIEIKKKYYLFNSLFYTTFTIFSLFIKKYHKIFIWILIFL